MILRYSLFLFQKGYPGDETVNHQTKDEEKRIEEIKNSILKFQEEITEFRKHVKPVRQVSADELPKWMKPSVQNR